MPAHCPQLVRVAAVVLTAVYVAAQPGLACGLACLARGHGAHPTRAAHDHHTAIAAACHSVALGPAATIPAGFEVGPSVVSAGPVLLIAPGDGALERSGPTTFAIPASPETDTPPPRS
jgi:hypothetical protein